MSCARMPRPTTVICGCGRSVKVKRFGPMPRFCRTCRDSRQAAQIAEHKERERSGVHHAYKATAIEGVEELEDGRKALGCKLEHLRAQVLALARDLEPWMPKAA